MTNTETVILSAVVGSIAGGLTTYVKDYFEQGRKEKQRKKYLQAAIVARLTSDISLCDDLFLQDHNLAIHIHSLGADWWDSIDFEVAYFFPKSYGKVAFYFNKLRILTTSFDLGNLELSKKQITSLQKISSAAYEAICNEKC